MSTRTALRPQQVIPSPQGNPVNSGSMSGNIVSAPTILQSLSMCSYSMSWTGSTPVGTVSVQCSNDYSLNPNGTVAFPGTWNTMTVSLNGTSVNSIPITGNTGTGFIDVDQTGAYALRLIYTAGSGTGTLSAIFAGKVS